MSELQFNPGNSKFYKIPTKRASGKYDRSKLRWNRVEDISSTFAGSFMPNRFLPVSFIDVTTEQAVVIPMCSIVSVKGFISSATNPSGIAGMAEYGISGDGKLVVTKTVDNENVVLDANDALAGYQEELMGLLTIANGGTDVTDKYSALDVEVGTLKPNGQLAADGDDAPTRKANIPAGIVLYDIWQDIRGKYFNYAQPTQYGATVMNKGKLRIPFVKESYIKASGNYNAAYKSVKGYYPFLIMPTNGMAEGSKLMSNEHGKFVKYNSSKTVEVGTIDEQVVGRFLFSDSRLVKSMLNYVDTYPGSLTAGTDTGGIEQAIYLFVEEILKKNNQPYTRDAILAKIAAGDFGLAYISVDIAS